MQCLDVSPWLGVASLLVGLVLGMALQRLYDCCAARCRGDSLQRLMREHARRRRAADARWKSLQAQGEADKTNYAELEKLLEGLEHALRLDERAREEHAAEEHDAATVGAGATSATASSRAHSEVETAQASESGAGTGLKDVRQADPVAHKSSLTDALLGSFKRKGDKGGAASAKAKDPEPPKGASDESQALLLEEGDTGARDADATDPVLQQLHALVAHRRKTLAQRKNKSKA
jgi:hypothetical protein